MTEPRSWRARAFLGCSMDGYIAGHNGDLTFLEAAPAAGKHVATSDSVPALVWETFFPQIDTMLMGRTTYDTVMAMGHWPYDTANVVVLSTTLDAETPNVTVVRSVEDAVRLFQTTGAAEIYVDGGRTVNEFLARGLLDEITISIVPTVIGGGTRLFADGVRADFVVRGSHATDDGLVRTTYEILRDSA